MGSAWSLVRVRVSRSSRCRWRPCCRAAHNASSIRAAASGTAHADCRTLAGGCSKHGRGHTPPALACVGQRGRRQADNSAAQGEAARRRSESGRPQGGARGAPARRAGCHLEPRGAWHKQARAGRRGSALLWHAARPRAIRSWHCYAAGRGYAVQDASGGRDERRRRAERASAHAVRDAVPALPEPRPVHHDHLRRAQLRPRVPRLPGRGHGRRKGQRRVEGARGARRRGAPARERAPRLLPCPEALAVPPVPT